MFLIVFKPTGCKGVFKTNNNIKFKTYYYKARLVAECFNQINLF